MSPPPRLPGLPRPPSGGRPGPRSRFLALALAALAGGCFGAGDIVRAPAAPTSTADAPAAPPPLASGRLPDTARPLRYLVSLVVDPTKDRFLGDVTIAVDVPAPTRAIVMHARDLMVSRAEAIAGSEPFPAETSFRAAAGTRDAPDELVLTFARPLPAGRAQIRLAYSAPLSDKLSGLYRVREGGQHYVYTQFEPTDARRMMPCFDEPGHKVPFELKVTTPKGNLAVSNTDEVERSDAEDGRSVTFRFAPTPPLPTYLFALAVGPLEVREGPRAPVKLRLVTTRGKAALGDLVLEAAAAHVRLLGEYFDRPFPYPKLDLVAVPEFGFGAMENAGLISFREETILLDSKAAPIEARRAMATAVAHEISHHWFGNLVTMKWWDDLWLNEGFANWMEARVVDTWRPTLDARLAALLAKGEVMGVDGLASARAVRRPVVSSSEAEEAFDSITYDKGAAVLGMLEAWLGPDAFREGVRAYIKAHENGSATAADLFQALSKASGKDVPPIASTFLDQPGVPLVRAELACEKDSPPRVRLAQERYRARASADRGKETWKIPICVAYEGAGRAGPACGLLDGPTAEIALPGAHCPKWIYPNANESGYFRFALPPAQMTALAAASRSLDARAKIGLLTNAWALVQSGDLGADVLLDVLEGMKRERSRLVIEQVASTLRHVGDVLVDDAVRPAFRAFAASLLLPIAKELGFTPRRGESDDNKLLRRTVLDALATLTEDPWLTGEAQKRAVAWLKDPRSVDGDIAAIALRVSTRRAGEKRLADLTAAVARAKQPGDRIVAASALGAFAEPPLLRRALDILLNDQVKIQDGFYVFNTALFYPDARPTVLAWLKDRFPELKTKLPDFALTRLAAVLETLCDPDARDDALRSFGDSLKAAEGGDHALQLALERATVCIEVRAREAARVKKRLGTSGKAGK